MSITLPSITLDEKFYAPNAHGSHSRSRSKHSHKHDKHDKHNNKSKRCNIVVGLGDKDNTQRDFTIGIGVIIFILVCWFAWQHLFARKSCCSSTGDKYNKYYDPYESSNCSSCKVVPISSACSIKQPQSSDCDFDDEAYVPRHVGHTRHM